MGLALRFTGHRPHPDETESEHGLAVGQETEIGRRRLEVSRLEVAGLRIKSRVIGRAHAMLQLAPEGDAIVAEFRSMYMPHVNGEHLRQTTVRLAVGDTVSFANSFDFVVVRLAS
jgi:pSer/pThr/pTyr-binding forkhead associated (FHA) protein